MPSPAPPKRTLLRRIARTLTIVVVIPYLGVVLLAALFQRSLIYHPARDASLNLTPPQIYGASTLPLSFQTADNLELHGWHVSSKPVAAEADGKSMRAQSKRGSEQPVFLYFCGNSGNRAHRLAEFKMLTDLGADVVCFDYCGFGDNHGNPSEEALARDARAIWQHLTDERHIEPNQIVIFGESLGGGVATRLAYDMSTAGIPPAGLVLRSTFSRLTDAAGWHFPWLPVRFLMLDRYPSVERITQVTCPTLVIHGHRDAIVPFEMGERLFAAAPEKSSQGIAKRLLPLKTADHNDVMVVEPEAVQKALGELLDAISPRVAVHSDP